MKKMLLIVGDVTYTNEEEENRETIINRVDRVELVEDWEKIEKLIEEVNLSKQNYVVIEFDNYFLKSIKNN